MAAFAYNNDKWSTFSYLNGDISRHECEFQMFIYACTVTEAKAGSLVCAYLIGTTLTSETSARKPHFSFLSASAVGNGLLKLLTSLYLWF